LTYKNQAAEHYDIDPETGYILPNNHPDTFFQPNQKVQILKYLEDRWNIPRACKDIGISRNCLYSHLTFDPKFKRDFEEILALHLGDTEQYIHDSGKKNFIPALAFLKRYDKRWVEKQQLSLPQEQTDKLDALLKMVDATVIDVTPDRVQITHDKNKGQSEIIDVN